MFPGKKYFIDRMENPMALGISPMDYLKKNLEIMVDQMIIKKYRGLEISKIDWNLLKNETFILIEEYYGNIYLESVDIRFNKNGHIMLEIKFSQEKLLLELYERF